MVFFHFNLASVIVWHHYRLERLLFFFFNFACTCPHSSHYDRSSKLAYRIDYAIKELLFFWNFFKWKWSHQHRSRNLIIVLGLLISFFRSLNKWHPPLHPHHHRRNWSLFNQLKFKFFVSFEIELSYKQWENVVDSIDKSLDWTEKIYRKKTSGKGLTTKKK